MPLFGKKKNKEDKKVEKVSTKVDNIKNKEEKSTSMKDLYGKTSTEKGNKKSTKKNKRNGSAYRVLVKPLITEKAADMGADNKYVFEVFKDVNKIEIAKAINEVYGVEPVKINILNKQGKKVRTGRVMGQRKDWKKAIITLPKGKTINIYEGV